MFTRFLLISVSLLGIYAFEGIKTSSSIYMQILASIVLPLGPLDEDIISEISQAESEPDH